MVANERRPVFSNDLNARIVSDELDSADADSLTSSIAWVLMPDHLHWLVPLKSGSLADLVQRVKGRSALVINRTSGQSGAVWQRGYHDHALRRDEELRDTARYIVANPLRAELVERIEDYPWWRAMWMEGVHGPYNGKNAL